MPSVSSSGVNAEKAMQYALKPDSPPFAQFLICLTHSSLSCIKITLVSFSLNKQQSRQIIDWGKKLLKCTILLRVGGICKAIGKTNGSKFLPQVLFSADLYGNFSSYEEL